MAQENQYYSNQIEEKSHDFLRHLHYSIRDYTGRLPNLRDIFRPQAIDWLLAESVKKSDNGMEPGPLIEFVVNSGYKDEPKVDEDGKPLLHRTTPIHRAYRDGYDDVSDLFKIYDRFDVNYTDETGRSHFHVACEFGRDDAVKKFLEVGQDPNCIVPETGDSPLHFALKNGKERVVKLLLGRGADPNLANRDGKTPMHIICEYTCDDVTANMLFELSDAKYQPLQINAQDNLGNTPLHMAMHDTDEWFVELLLRHGADPNATNEEGSTPLHDVCKQRLELKDFLEIFFKIAKEVDRVVEVDARDKLGRTPLQWAVANFLPDVVGVLFDRGADLSNFAFPTESYIVDGDEFNNMEFKLSAASQAMEVVERLQRRGYELRRNDALTITKFFAKWRLFESAYLDEFWYENENFAAKAKRILMHSGRSLYDAIRLAPKKAARILTYDDYMGLWNLSGMYQLPQGHKIFANHLCEKVSRGFFRRWALDPFLELTHYRLPLLCCDKIIDQLMNEDLINVCLAATDQSS